MARTTVYIDEDLKPLLKIRGVTNLSETVRELCIFLVGDGETELTKTQIRDLTRQFAKLKLAELQKQQKITGQSEEELQKIQVFKDARMQKIRNAVLKEMELRGSDRFRKYILHDDFGDYSTIQDDIISQISKDAGIPVALCDVIVVLQAAHP